MIRAGISGFIGYETCAALARENREELKTLFSDRFLKAFDKLSFQTEDAWEGHFNESGFMLRKGCYMTGITEGGLFGTLWRALEDLETISGVQQEFPGTGLFVRSPAGCRIDLRKIPVKQEIIEICELFHENPYEVPSKGAYLLLWDEDRICSRDAGDTDLKDYIERRVTEIGYITHEKDRLIINGDMIRYLTPLNRQMTDISARARDLGIKNEQENTKEVSDGKKR